MGPGQRRWLLILFVLLAIGVLLFVLADRISDSKRITPIETAIHGELSATQLTASPSQEPTVTLIGEEAAIKIAVRIAREGHGHLSAALEGPVNVRAEFYEWQNVWRIKMDGLWMLVGGPLPEEGEPTPKPQIFHHLTIELTPTGEFKGLSAN